MNIVLKMFKEKSKSTSGWNSIKKYEHGKDESKKWKTYIEAMVFKEAKGRANRARALTTQAYSPTHPKARLQRKWRDTVWEVENEAFKQRAPSERGDWTARTCTCKKIFHLKLPPNHQKETFVVK
jgi:hypothetical protein